MNQVFNMDCVMGMSMYPDNHFDSIVCDPPYELGFMGKAWDNTGIANNPVMWAEALRVLKPGGHLLAFSGSRTYHRMTCAIEDAGFEVRDQIMWVYGSGFPKSLDVSKAIDKAAGAAREMVPRVRTDGKATGQEASGFMGGASSVAMTTSTEGITDAARQWEGWGTALKPAHEPICVARKPLIGTVAANVLAHGTGALNIDGCRVGTETVGWGGARGGSDDATQSKGRNYRLGEGEARPVEGRWPANLVHDGSAEVVALFPNSKSCSSPSSAKPEGTIFGGARSQGSIYPGEDGSAARFFYCAKTSKADRGADNIHPTVKPTDLMRYLCRLVTPPGGLILDPFAGSGSTGKAATLEGFRFVGFELSAEYCAIANARMVQSN